MRTVALLPLLLAIAPATDRAAVTSAAAPARPTAKSPVPAKVELHAMAFNPKELDLAPGETYLTELYVPSPTRKELHAGVRYEPGRGTSVQPDNRFQDRIPGWGVKLYPHVSAAADAAGEIPVTASVEGHPETKATMLVRVAAPLIEPVPGEFKLTVRVTNPFRTRTMTGRIVAANPDRFLQNITTREFRVAPGMTGEVVFPLPGAAPATGETYDFTLTVQTYQGYKSKKTYPLTFPPHTDR